MAADESRAGPRPASVAGAIRRSFALSLEWAVPFVATNLAWAMVVGAYLLLLVGFPILAFAAPLLAIPTSALMRLAVVAVRSGVPTLPVAWAEMGRLPQRKAGVAFVQLLLLGVTVANLDLSVRIGGALGLLSAGVALYAAVATAIVSIAIWPIVCDPAREGTLRDQLRLALSLVVRRPLQLLVLALLTVLAVYVSTQLLVPTLVRPTVVLLAIAGYVVPAADALRPTARST